MSEVRKAMAEVSLPRYMQRQYDKLGAAGLVIGMRVLVNFRGSPVSRLTAGRFWGVICGVDLEGAGRDKTSVHVLLDFGAPLRSQWFKMTDIEMPSAIERLASVEREA